MNLTLEHLAVLNQFDSILPSVAVFSLKQFEDMSDSNTWEFSSPLLAIIPKDRQLVFKELQNNGYLKPVPIVRYLKGWDIVYLLAWMRCNPEESEE